MRFGAIGNIAECFQQSQVSAKEGEPWGLLNEYAALRLGWLTISATAEVKKTSFGISLWTTFLVQFLFSIQLFVGIG